MRSSMSSSSSPDSRPKLSIVIGSSAPPESLEACLEALEPQLADDVEVLVEEAVASPTPLRERFGWARFSERPASLVPELWRDGIDAAHGEIVALTIAPMVPAPDWVAQLRELHESYDAVAGAIDPGERLRASDWAEYFCRYAREMRPFEGHDTVDLPGDNASYKRGLLESVRDSYRDGFWEPVVHRLLQAQGVRLRQEPVLVVHQGRSAGAGAFAAQRLAHGRKYGHQRGASFSRPRNLIGVLASPLVPFLMSWRVLSRVLSRRRYRLRAVLVVPLIFWFNLVWAYAEARGHLDVLRRG
jgi:hypothetical protein